MPETVFLSASLWRRLAAMVYDSLLMFAVLIVIGATMLTYTRGLGMNQNDFIFKLYLFGAIFLFLGWFWTHGGQTLGMRAWKIRLVQNDGSPVSWRHALIYYLVSLPMWGFIIFAIVVNAGIYPTPHAIAQTPHSLLYGLALIWFLFDHMPNNWRQKVAKIKMVQVK
ncbi:MAG: RDD family protein [Gammaproteobacteria bacterium]